jgi:hypothetical protein
LSSDFVLDELVVVSVEDVDELPGVLPGVVLISPPGGVVLDPMLDVLELEEPVSAGGVVGAGAGAGADAAGGGVTVVVLSSFLHAVRPIATRAMRRSERFIFYPFWRSSG